MERRSPIPQVHRRVPLAALAAVATLMACAEPTTQPLSELQLAPAQSSLTFASGSHVTTWDPIIPAAAYGDWGSTVCTSSPLVGRHANWVNPHNAYVLESHPWAYDYFFAPWINSWNSLASIGPGGHSWTKYSTTVQGNGSFVIRLLADNCSWIYLDGTLVGVQGTDLAANSYGLTLNGQHTLEFIIFDGGGAAGGKYILETTTTPPPPLNPDLDGDTHPNDADAFPLDPTEWADSDGDGHGDNGDAYPNDPTRWLPEDSDGDGVMDDQDAFPMNPAEWADSDGDGTGNNADAHDNSNTGATIVIGSCDSGVRNTNLDSGTWSNDLIADARAAAANHGAFVRAVAALADGWKKVGKITGREQGAIVSCAARSK